MRYRPSSYNIVIKNEKEDNYILVNGQTKALDVVDSDLAVILKGKAFVEDGVFNEDEKKILLERGYLTDLKEDDEKQEFIKFVKKLHSMKSKNASITIIPTYQCNLNCFYCFESSQNSREVITVDLVDKAFNVFDDSLSRLSLSPKGMAVSLFGGEPLLAANKKIIKYIYNETIKREMKVAVVTNGTQLQHFFDVFEAENCALIQITLDGIKKEHDKRRVTKSGKGTFDKIVENINGALRRGYPISVRINVDTNNLEMLESLNDFVIEQGWDKNNNVNVYCSQIYNTGNPDKANLATPFLVYEHVKEIENFKIGIEKDGVRERVLKVLNGDNLGFLNTGFCATDYNESYVFDPYGDVYDCIANIGKKEFVIGNYKDGKLNKKTNRRVMSACGSIVDKKHCIDKNCKFMLFCGGGCPERVSGDKEVFYKHFCPDFAKSFHLIVREHVTSLLKNGCS